MRHDAAPFLEVGVDVVVYVCRCSWRALGRRAWKVRGASGWPVIAAFAAAQTVRGFFGHAKSARLRRLGSQRRWSPLAPRRAASQAPLGRRAPRGRVAVTGRRSGCLAGAGRRGAAPCAFFVLGHQRRDGFVLGRRASRGHEGCPCASHRCNYCGVLYAAAHWFRFCGGKRCEKFGWYFLVCRYAPRHSCAGPPRRRPGASRLVDLHAIHRAACSMAWRGRSQHASHRASCHAAARLEAPPSETRVFCANWQPIR